MCMNYYWFMRVKYFSSGEKCGRVPLQHAPAALHICIQHIPHPPSMGMVGSGNTSQNKGTVPRSAVPNRTVPLSGIEALKLSISTFLSGFLFWVVLLYYFFQFGMQLSRMFLTQKSLYPGKRNTVSPAVLETFIGQAECLQMPSPIMIDPNNGENFNKNK